MLRNFALALATLVLITSNAVAEDQQTAKSLPWIELPQRLKPYANLDRVLAATKSTIDLLATTRFDITKDAISSSCQSDHIIAVYRGAVMALGAHKAFVNTMEIGWPSMERGIADSRGWGRDATDWKEGDPVLTHPSRSLLATVWSPEKYIALFTPFSEMKKLPSDIRSDLRSFFHFIVAGHDWWKIVKTRAAHEWRLVLRSQERDYLPAKSYAKSSAQTDASLKNEKFDEKAFEKSWPDLFNTDASPHLRKIYNSVRGPTDAAIDSCYDSLPDLFKDGYFRDASRFRATYGKDRQLEINTFVGPIKYVFLFWHRRDTEGTVSLARHFLTGLMDILASPDELTAVGSRKESTRPPSR